MRNLILLLLLTFSSIQLTAQELIMVYSVEGKVKYMASPDAKAVKVIPGMKLMAEGTLQIKEGGKVGLYNDEQLGMLAAAGKHKVDDVVRNVNLFEETDLASIFGKAIEKATHPYFASVKISRSGFVTNTTSRPAAPADTRKPKDKEEREGHGNKQFKIIRVSPTGGKVSGDTIFFRWKIKDSIEVGKLLTLTVREKGGDNIAELPAKKLGKKVPVSRLKLKEGSTYEWFVSDATDNTKSSPPVEFVYVGMEEDLAILKALSEDSMYQGSNATSKRLMEASMYEQKGYAMKAFLKYRAASRGDKKNKLARNMYKSFLFYYDIID